MVRGRGVFPKKFSDVDIAVVFSDGLAIQRNRLAHRYLNFRGQAVKMYHGNKDAVLKLIQLILELEKKKKDAK